MSFRPSRRALLRSSIATGALLAADLWPGHLWADSAPQTSDFTFLCVNDLHYFDHHGDSFFQQMVKQMNATQPVPDFCLVVGDLAQDGRPEQFGPIRDHLRQLRFPCSFVIGNHDFLTDTDRHAFDEMFPKSNNYVFEHKGWQLIGADTTQGKKGMRTNISHSTLDWLGQTASSLNRKRPTIFFTHFPLGFLVIARPENADDALHPFRDFNLQAVFNGHFHAQTTRHWRSATITTDKCCSYFHPNHDGTPQKGYFVCTAKDGKVSREFVEVNAPSITTKGSFLLSF
ncbi:MAG TPA: metallophosphoesterase [Tepidisphaeraceae bacterium]|jgi:3',5'-cyclic AMP phosphodiesterase CpdA